MASDVLVDAHPQSSPRVGSPALSSLDTDVANTSSARVFFGSLQDAEKYARLSQADECTPARRSQRLSLTRLAPDVTASSSDNETEENKEGADSSEDADTPIPSRPTTPTMQDDIINEPASALACKVMRAWDNPSPPPSPSITPPTPDDGQETEVIPVLLLRDVDPLHDPEVPTASVEDWSSAADPLTTASPSLPEPSAESLAEAQEDLISFDSFSIPPGAPVMTVIAPTVPSTPTRIPASSSTVDELLAISPMPHKHGSSSVSQSTPLPALSSTAVADLLGRKTALSIGEDPKVDTVPFSGAFDPLDPVDQPQANIRFVNPLLDIIMTDPHIPEVLQQEAAGTSTPLRRSSRPRRSVSPYVASPSKTRASRSPALVDQLQTPNLAGPARRKSVKSKIKALLTDSSDIESGSGLTSGDEQSAQPPNGSEHNAIAVGSSPPPDPAPVSQHTRDSLLTPERDATSNASPEHAPYNVTIDGGEIGNAEALQAAEPGNETRSTTRLGSLSPNSNDVLSCLLSLEGESYVSPHGLTTLDTSGNNLLATPQRPCFPLHDQAATTQTPRSRPPSTPTQSKDDNASSFVHRTPARRIPIADAVAEGIVSPQKSTAQLFITNLRSNNNNVGTPVFRPRALDDLARTPAKRILVSEVGPPSPTHSTAPPGQQSQGAHHALAKPFPRRQPSTETSNTQLGPGFFATPQGAPVQQVAQPSMRLPYPITSAKTSRPVAPESRSTEDASVAPVASRLAQKHDPEKQATSGQRQPTVRLQSKIPRVGKPYARPALGSTSKVDRSATPVAKTTVAGSNTSAVDGKRAESKTSNSASPPASVARPVRLRKVISTKPVIVESDESDGPMAAQAGPGPKTTASRAAAVAAATRQPTPPVAPATTLKRKRDNTAGDSMYQASGTRPVVLLRRVVSAKNQNQENATKAPHTPSPASRLVAATKGRTSPARRTSPVKQSQAQASGTPVPKIQMRKVVDARKGKVQGVASPAPEVADQQHLQQSQTQGTADVITPSIESEASQQPLSENPDAPAAAASALPQEISSNSTVPVSTPQEQTERNGQALAVQRPSTPPPSDSELPAEAEQVTQQLRRTSRTRRQTSDVFGPVPAPRTAQSRRKPVLLGPPDTSVFSGMSMLALKTLTNNNTLRNQKQLVELETEVVVKDGKRPDSPTTKVRTTLEKQREVRVKEREERAARRAKRLAEKAGDGADEGGDGEDGEGVEGEEIDPEDSMMTDVELAEPEGPPLRHRRGPGDESDYVTPERPIKRGRFEDDVEAGLDKRVKWDQGLHTTVYLDDTPPRPRRPTKEEEATAAAARKGCLAASAKTIRLDNMGNALNAEDPMPNLVVEHVVVKKFVYEDDEVPELEPPAEPVAKATRSKSKKAKAS